VRDGVSRALDGRRAHDETQPGRRSTGDELLGDDSKERFRT